MYTHAYVILLYIAAYIQVYRLVWCNTLNKRIYIKQPQGRLRINSNNNYSPRYPMQIRTCFSIGKRERGSGGRMSYSVRAVNIHSVHPAVCTIIIIIIIRYMQTHLYIYVRRDRTHVGARK